jgi:hypothetical protein
VERGRDHHLRDERTGDRPAARIRGGGEPTVLTKPDRERGEGDHLWPEFLPGGEAVLFTITPANGSIENAQIAVLDLRTGTSKVLIRGGSHAHYVPTGIWSTAPRGLCAPWHVDLGRLEGGSDACTRTRWCV